MVARFYRRCFKLATINWSKLPSSKAPVLEPSTPLRKSLIPTCTPPTTRSDLNCRNRYRILFLPLWRLTLRFTHFKFRTNFARSCFIQSHVWACLWYAGFEHCTTMFLLVLWVYVTPAKSVCYVLDLHRHTMSGSVCTNIGRMNIKSRRYLVSRRYETDCKRQYGRRLPESQSTVLNDLHPSQYVPQKRSPPQKRWSQELILPHIAKRTLSSHSSTLEAFVFSPA